MACSRCSRTGSGGRGVCCIFLRSVVVTFWVEKMTVVEVGWSTLRLCLEEINSRYLKWICFSLVK